MFVTWSHPHEITDKRNAIFLLFRQFLFFHELNYVLMFSINID